MFAVVETGGKQYKVKEQDFIGVERLKAEIGDEVSLRSLATFGREGNGKFSFGEGSTVRAEVVSHYRADKIVVFKKRRRKNYRRKNGHRQDMTVLRVVEVR